MGNSSVAGQFRSAGPGWWEPGPLSIADIVQWTGFDRVIIWRKREPGKFPLPSQSDPLRWDPDAVADWLEGLTWSERSPAWQEWARRFLQRARDRGATIGPPMRLDVLCWCGRCGTTTTSTGTKAWIHRQRTQDRGSRMDKLGHELEQMRAVMHRLADEAFADCPSEAARQAVGDVIDTSDGSELAMATLFLRWMGAGIDAEVVRSARGWARLDAMH
jgi:predicted DNA-binding transcriptional regulator AlpA